MQKSSSFLLPFLPKGVQTKPNVCQKTWNCSAANFSWKRLLSIPKCTVTCFFTAFCTPFLLYYPGNSLDSLSSHVQPWLVPFLRWLSRNFVTPQIMVTAKLSKSVSYSAQGSTILQTKVIIHRMTWVSELKCASCWWRRWRMWQEAAVKVKKFDEQLFL